MPASSSRVERVRRSYKPRDVRVLFIGESAPAGETFFYCANSGLYRATSDAFAAAIPSVRKSPDFREDFQRLGCFLDDLSLTPVNNLPRLERKQACRDGIAPLARRIRRHSPAVVVIIGIGIAEHVSAALEKAGHGGVERVVLPFPSSRPRRADGVPYRQVYVQELSKLVRSWRRRKLLLTPPV